MKRNYNGWDAYDLPATTQKDYYGKAVVIEDGGNTILKSYNTLVCSIDADGNFHRHWYGYSRTTMNHINDFIRLFGIDGGGKKWWDSFEPEVLKFS